MTPPLQQAVIEEPRCLPFIAWPSAVCLSASHQQRRKRREDSALEAYVLVYMKAAKEKERSCIGDFVRARPGNGNGDFLPSAGTSGTWPHLSAGSWEMECSYMSKKKSKAVLATE